MKNYFEEIYHFAKEKNEGGLKELTAKHVHFGQRESGTDMSAAMKLAFEGDFAAIKLLMHSGITIHEVAYGAAMGKYKRAAEMLRVYHHADVHWIAEGAARGGDKEYAEWLRINHHANVNRIAFGAARGGDKEYAEWLRANHHVNVNRIASAAANSGDKEYAEWLRINHHADVNRIAFGAANGGYKEYAEWLRVNHHANASLVAFGAARGGDKEYAEWLRISYRADANCIAFAAAYSGYKEYAEWLRVNHHADVNRIASGAASGGYNEYADWLRVNHHADVNQIAFGAARAGYKEYADWLRINHHADVNRVAEGAARFGDLDYLLQLFSQADSHRKDGIAEKFTLFGNDRYWLRKALSLLADGKDRKHLAQKVLKNDSHINDILLEAQQIRSLMKRQISYASAERALNSQLITFFLVIPPLCEGREGLPALALDLMFHINTFLTGYDAKGMLLLYKTKMEQFNQRALIFNLREYSEKFFGTFRGYYYIPEATELLTAIGKATDITEINKMVVKQKAMFDESPEKTEIDHSKQQVSQENKQLDRKDPLYGILCRFIKRYDQFHPSDEKDRNPPSLSSINPVPSRNPSEKSSSATQMPLSSSSLSSSSFSSSSLSFSSSLPNRTVLTEPVGHKIIMVNTSTSPI